jgi:hypothetical protein
MIGRIILMRIMKSVIIVNPIGRKNLGGMICMEVDAILPISLNMIREDVVSEERC